MQERIPDLLFDAEILVVLPFEDHVQTFVGDQPQFSCEHGQAVDTVLGGSLGILCVETAEALGSLLKYFNEVILPCGPRSELRLRVVA